MARSTATASSGGTEWLGVGWAWVWAGLGEQGNGARLGGTEGGRGQWHGGPESATPLRPH